MIVRAIISITLFLIVLSQTNCSNENRVLARIETVKIEAIDFQVYLASLGKPALYRQMQDWHYYLEQYIDRKLKLLDAYANGLDNDPYILNQVKQTKERAILEQVFEKQIGQKVVPDSLVKVRYDLIGKYVKCRHIFLPIDTTESQEEINKKYRQLSDLRTRLFKGDSFSDLAQTYSKDHITAKNGGYLGVITWNDRKYNYQFNTAVLDLTEGEISSIINSDKGIHLVEVLDVLKTSMPSFNKIKDYMRQVMYSQFEYQLAMREEEFNRQVQKSFDVEYNNHNIQLFLDRLKEIRRKQSGKRLILKDIELFLAPNILDLVLIEMPKNSFRVRTLMTKNQSQMMIAAPIYNSESEFKKALEEYIPNDSLKLEWGYRHHYDKNSEVHKKVRTNKELFMIQERERRVVDSLYSEPTEKDLIDYYHTHRSEYVLPAKYKVQEIWVNTPELAERILERARSGADFDSLADKFNQRALSKYKSGHIGYITDEQHGKIGQRAAEMKIGEIAGPIPIQGNYIIIQVLDIKPAIPKTFEQSKSEIKLDIRSSLRDQIKKNWLNSLHDKYTVLKYESNLKEAYSNYTELKTRTQQVKAFANN